MTVRAWFKSVTTWIAILSIVPLLSGCWDRLEIEDRAVVLGISVDTVSPEEAEQEKEDEITHLRGSYLPPGGSKIRVGVQLAVPGRIPLGPGGGMGSGTGSSSRTVWVLDVIGNTIDDALMNLQQQVSGQLFFGHLRVIVVSEDLARKGLQNLNDYFRRNSQLRRMAWMMVSRGKALDLMQTTPELQRVPTFYLLSTMDSAVRMGKLPVNYVGMYWSRTSKLGQEGFLPYVEMKKNQNIEIEGLAYFRKDRMVGSTNPFQIASYMSVMGMNPAGYRGMIQVGSPERTVMVYATYRKATRKVDIRNGVPHFTLNLFFELNLEEKVSHALTIDRSSLLKQINRLDEEGIAKSVTKLIEETKQAHSDIFGFGEYVRALKPGFWRKHVKNSEAWEEMYGRIQIDIKVHSNLRRIGMKAR
ncbi:Ger(x)C family spore germination protein [Cohnella zeiphila]|uniref:Ger(X)C family spore germination protein n=1 Tax=Cohnella zeiphila TaxID=2761120 RepID=A0A7X0SRC2_9BACL|nr:Ger(x)C family spore germination protein [Cohnella zeiphila]MBB6734531.1 Ger(x)C family spore germination protein [Cohnella zeiphila]